MKKFVSGSTLAFLAAMVAGGIAAGDAHAASKRKPGFLEQLFGTNRNEPYSPRNRHRSLFGGWKDDPSYIDGKRAKKSAGKKKKSNFVIVDADPEGDSGLGMGNLTYVPPKLVPLSGVKLAEARPMEAAPAAIHDQLSTDVPALRVLPSTREAIVAQYAAQGFRPMWVKDGKLSERGAAVLKLLSAAGEEGLQPQSYLPGGLASYDALPPEIDPTAMARLDIDLTGAALRYARDASGGQFDPARLSRYHDVAPPWVPADKTVKVLAFSPFAADYLKSLHPTHPAYAAMKTALAEFREEQAKPRLDLIADGGIVKKGGTDPRIPAIRSRLAELGYAAPATEAGEPDMLDAELTVQLRLFQKSAGIRVTGAVGPQTVAALNNAGSAGSVDRLLDNMERVRWLPRDLGRRYVFVNQAAYQAQVISDGKPEWTTRVIVGKPNTQTAVFSDEMEMVVFNPSWGVPPSIIANEYLPKLRRDPGYLDRIGFKVVNQKGKVVSSRSVPWGSYGSKVPYGIQQPPGEDNALGEIKFLFPNSHDIYMHDTPSRELFEREGRAFSHGCVRVQNPRDFASVLLGWTPDEVAAKVDEKGSETVRLSEKIPVHLTYFTAWPDETGKIVFFKDIYGRDKPIENARSSTLVAQR